MTLTPAFKQLSKAAAIFAFALLWAQTAALVHDHEPSEPEHCVVCSASTEQASAPAPPETGTTLVRSEHRKTSTYAAPQSTPLRSQPARGPPTV